MRLAEADDSEVEELDNAVDEDADTERAAVPLAVRRREAILAALRASGCRAACSISAAGQGQLVGRC